MDVNFWGIKYAIQAFVPHMIEQGKAGWIVHSGSKQGITNPPGNTIYNITKSALKTYTEALERGDFYIICPDGEVIQEMDAKRIAWAAGDIVSGRPPLSRWYDDYKKAFEEFTP